MDQPASEKMPALPSFGLAEEVLQPRASPAVPAPAQRPPAGLLEWLGSLPASEREGPAPSEPPVQLVAIELGHELYGIEIHRVQEVLRVGPITRVPGAPSPFIGITSLRGKILPVLDLRLRLDLPPSEAQARRRIVVVELHERLLGLLVDAVVQVLPLPASKIEPPPEGSDLIGGVAQVEGGRLILLLELERLLEKASHA
jgi:purine-binding chemotaxis protein CheW